jgi:hypothetical protein
MVLWYVGRGLDKQTDDVVRLLPSGNKHEVSIKLDLRYIAFLYFDRVAVCQW